jgi:hypothetical protein
MNLIGEFLVEIIFRRIIVEFFGYYTIFGFYKITKNQKGVTWLTKAAAHEGEEFGKGCIISIVGLLSFSVLITIIVYLFF